jgi:protein tyrosine/serine phosphatase
VNKKRLVAFGIVPVASVVIAATVVIIGKAFSEDTGPAARTHVLSDDSAEVRSSLPLFHRLNEEFVRGSQPLRGGVGVLERLGVKTIIDLRSAYDHTSDIGVAAEQRGLRYHWAPMSVWSPPTDEETKKFLSLVTDEGQGPFFVFCADGLNRVGEMSAIYRIARDKWSVEESLIEMDKLGFNPYYYTLRAYVWTYARKHHPDSLPESARRLSPFE